MPIPIAFEVTCNGRKVCTAGLRGKPGVLAVILTSVDGTGHDQLTLDAGGLDSATQEHLTWAKRTVSIGDEIVVRLVESMKTTRIRSRAKRNPVDDLKRAKAYLRATAKKYGYKLVKV